MNEYLLQEIKSEFTSVPVAIIAPSGYKLHSWQSHVRYQDGIPMVTLCWVKESVATNALAHVPTELLAPVADWIKRWLIKNT